MPHPLLPDILEGRIGALSKAITLVESSLPRHRTEALSLLGEVHPHSGNSVRIGITGIPGVGKSSFIESLGLKYIEAGHKVAVLAIDPSSVQSKGSILGDKTRMEELMKSDNAYIRPSPSSGTLGGVAGRTREVMLLCEAAGFDIILVETVGVGQSETQVINITDVFVLLAIAGAGDELQGIKRGIMEMADILVINKADGNNVEASRRAKKQLQSALHYFPSRKDQWSPIVQTASAHSKAGIDDLIDTIARFQSQMMDNGHWQIKRGEQQITALRNSIETGVFEQLRSMGLTGTEFASIDASTNEYAVAQTELQKIFEKLKSGT